MNLTSVVLVLSSLTPVFAETCDTHQLTGNSAIEVSICMRCTETDSGACVYYEMTQCFMHVNSSEKIPVNCGNLTCPAPTPSRCPSKQSSSSPYGGIEGDFLSCADGTQVRCSNGKWSKAPNEA